MMPLPSPQREHVVFNISLVFTNQELAEADTPTSLRALLDAKVLNLRNSTMRALHDYYGREVDATPLQWFRA